MLGPLEHDDEEEQYEKLFNRKETQDAFDDMDVKLAQWENEGVFDRGSQFRVSLRKDQNTYAATGRPYDGFRGESVGEGIPFARKYFGQQTKTYATLLYGDEFASHLAGEWCRRMQHYYNIFASSGDPQYMFTEADNTFVSSDSQGIILNTMPVDCAQWIAANELEHLYPR